MPMLNTVARMATKPLPRMLSPKGHAVVDYFTVGAFLASAAWFWGRNKRASLAAFVCGGAELAVNLLTDYPGGVRKVISFRTHRDIDFGLGTMSALMPELFAFRDDAEKTFFGAQGAVITAVSQVTRMPQESRRWERRSARARAA